MATGNSKQGQYAMRGRVAAQAFTIVVVAAGMLYSASSEGSRG